MDRALGLEAPTTPPEVSLAVDIGGTFTDVVLTGAEVFTEKTLTTHDDLVRGVHAGVVAALRRAGINASDVTGWLVHATTVVTNALIERKGPRTGLILTEGFPDILKIRDERRYDLYDTQLDFPEPLISARYTYTMAERTLADGSIERPVDENEVDALAAKLAADQIESVAICFLHSYKNPANEQKLARALKDRLPGLYVSASCEIAPQIREYLRASTTSVNAYTVPVTQPYLGKIGQMFADMGVPVRPLIMLSSGGVIGSTTAGKLPVRMIESGPAAGAQGASHVARALDLDEMIAFDMGGTTAKVCLIQGHRPLVTGVFEVDRIYRHKPGSGMPVSAPCVDMIEIGSGGGSIAHVNAMGLLNVGPRSAGSMPGPACYGRGGMDPTVTDADVLLGAIDPTRFLGGAMQLDVKAAETAIASIAGSLNLSPIAAARGIYQLVCESMAAAVRTHAVERGVDYRGIPMLAFGGAGPVHACDVARLLRSTTVVFPKMASVFSAFGCLVAPVRIDLVHSFLAPLKGVDWAGVSAIFIDLEEKGVAALLEAGCRKELVGFSYAADVRYVGQQYEISVDLTRRPSGEADASLLRAAFEAEYLKRYNLVQAEADIEVVNWRVTASGPKPSSNFNTTRSPSASGVLANRTIHVWGDDQVATVVARDALECGRPIAGPAVIEDPDTSMLIPPGWVAHLNPEGAVIAEFKENSL